jgi:hypothetical protein
MLIESSLCANKRPPESDQSSQHHTTPPQTISPRSILMVFTYLRFDFPSGLILSGFPTHNFYAFHFFSVVLNAVYVRLFHMSLAKSKNYKAPHYDAFYNS